MLETVGSLTQEGCQMNPKTILLVTLFVLTVIASASNGYAMPLFADTSKRAVFLSPIEEWRSTWNLEEYVSLLESAGYQVDVLMNGNVSISFLKSGLSDYDIIILRTDSFYYEGFSYFCTGEPVTDNASETFAQEISNREIHVGACIGFSAEFIRLNYLENSLRPGLVFVIDGYSAELSSPFISAGASVYVGYYDAYPLGWGRIDALSIKWLSYLAKGNSVKEATPLLYNYLTGGHGDTASWPTIFWYGNGTYKI